MTLPAIGQSAGLRRSIYFKRQSFEDIRSHAQRLQRSVSWVVDYVWKHGREALEEMQGPRAQEEQKPESATG